ncbi:S-layer homology domain-containing protein [Peribacillus deserti]|uniref:S-layer homology domain-containing protein n=1 Tax=Peribacillus deserti TaxID=673318 RepID=UPI0035B5063D
MSQAKAASQISKFKDTQKHPAKQAIDRLVSLGVIKGYKDGTFRPENKVKRVEFIDMITKMMNYPRSSKASIALPFKDIKPGYSAYPAIEAAVKQGILSKNDFGDKFNPNQLINRNEMAVITAKALQLKQENTKYLTFRDKKDIKKQVGLVSAVVKRGLVSGYSDKTFKPAKGLTRAEASVYLVRMYDYLNGVFFTDIENHASRSAIQSLVGLGILSGYKDGKFYPEKTVTRADFVTFLIRTMGYKPEKAKPTFEDVKPSSAAYSSIQAAGQQGIIKPSEYGRKFSPNKLITRQEMAVFLARTLKLKPENPSILKFKDKKSITVKDQAAVASVVKAGLMSSYKDNQFSPKTAVTRAQASVSLKKLYDYSINTPNPDIPTASPDRTSKDEIKVQSYVKEIPKQALGSLESVTDGDSTFIFKGTPANVTTLKKGDIFTLPSTDKFPGGFAEKVISVVIQNGKTIVKTVNPEFTEVFNKLDVQEDKDISIQDLVPISIPEGVTVDGLEEGDPSSIKSYSSGFSEKEEKEKGKGFKINLREFKLEANNVTMKINGAVDFKNAKLETDVDYSFFKLKTFETRFVSDPSLSLKGEITKEIASGEAGGKGTYSKVYKGIDFGTKANVPSWMSGKESTGPFEKQKSIGKFYLPVYGPVGANLEAFLVIKADLTVGIHLEFIQDVHMDAGIKAKEGKVEYKPQKAEFEEPVFLIKGNGGAQLKAGPGIGVKLAVFKLSVGGLEGKLGLTGEIYGQATGGYGDQPDPNEEQNARGLKFCFRAGAGAFAEVTATLDLLEKLYIIKNAEVTLLKKNWKFGEYTNCKDGMLAANPKFLILAPGESKEIDLGLFEFDKTELKLSRQEDKLKNTTLSHSLSGDKVLAINSTENKNGYKYTVKVDEKALPGDIAEVEFTYQGEKDSKKIEDSITVFVLNPEKIEAEPSQVTLKPGGKKQLTVNAVFEEPTGKYLDKLKEEGISLKDLVNVDVTSAEGIMYKSKNPAVAEVDSKGNITANSQNESSTEIEISYKGKIDTVLVNVEQPPANGGGSGQPAILSEEQIKSIILEAEKKADGIFRPEAESEDPDEFNAVKGKLLDYYSDNYLDGYWKKIYEVNIAWFTDPHLLYPLSEAISSGTAGTFKVSSQSVDSVKASVEVPLRDNEIKGDAFEYQYSIKKINGKWLLDDIDGIDNERPQDD